VIKVRGWTGSVRLVYRVTVVGRKLTRDVLSHHQAVRHVRPSHARRARDVAGWCRVAGAGSVTAADDAFAGVCPALTEAASGTCPCGRRQVDRLERRSAAGAASDIGRRPRR
jgi:hypothetical protein